MLFRSPRYSGGETKLFEFLRDNIKYPKVERRKGIAGRVIISFVIDKDGSVKNVKIFKGVSSGIDEEALRVIRLMPKWSAGMQDGNPVSVQFSMPINFSLK